LVDRFLLALGCPRLVQVVLLVLVVQIAEQAVLLVVVVVVVQVVEFVPEWLVGCQSLVARLD
jgi:hypothetical protein